MRQLANVKRAARAADDSVARLHDQMRQARAAGATLQQIADAAGLTRQRVHQILRTK